MEIILGTAKTGKTTYLFQKLDKYINENKKIIYLVPSQTRVVTEENYLKFKNKSGILGINFTTISSFIKEYILVTSSKNKDKYIGSIERKLILSMLVLEDNNLNIFNKVRNKEGFIENLSIYMDIFKKQELDSDKIDKLNLDNKILELKLKELNEMYKEYINFTKDLYIDNLDEMDLFNNLFFDDFSNVKDIDDYIFIFDSYNNFTKKEFKFISNLIKLKANIKFAITSDVIDEDIIYKELPNIKMLLTNNDISGIYDISNLTLYCILKEAKKYDCDINLVIKYNKLINSKDDIKYLATNIFTTDNTPKIKSQNIEINLYPNIYEEIKVVSKKIVKYIEKGYRYNDFAILTGNIDEYKYPISKIFLEYNIPNHIDFKYKLSSNFLVKYIIKLLEFASFGYKKEILFELLKSGFVNISYSNISYLENYMLEFNIEGFKFLKEFKINNKENGKIYDLQVLNNIRENVIKIFENMYSINKENVSVDSIIKKIYIHLETNNIITRYFNIIDEYKKSEDPKVIYTAKINEEGYNYIVKILDSMYKIYKNKEISIKEFLRLFNMSCKEINLKSILPTIDEVLIADINSTKLNNKKIIFFVGINENVFPSTLSKDILFNDNELTFLDEEEIKIKETSTAKFNMELFNFYENINNINDKLYISYLSADSSGKSLRKSTVIDEVLKIVDTKIIGNVTGNEVSNIFNIRSKIEALDELSLRKNKEINKDILSLYKYLIQDKEYNNLLSYNRNTDKLSEDTTKKLYKEKINMSISRLELFSKCNFAYHLKYNLKLDERKIYSITSMDIGTLMHDIVEKFSRYLFDSNIMWHEILLEKEKYNNIIEEIIYKEIDRVFSKHEENIKYMVLKQKLIATMKKVLLTIATSFNNSKFVPFGIEAEFGENSQFSPIEITLEDGKIINLIGKIDRIDILETDENSYIRIVDYKSSNKTLNLDDIKEKISLQLITYLSAIINNLNKSSNKIVKPAGMLYFTLSERLLNIKDYTEDETKIKEKLTEALKMKGILLKDSKIMKLMDKEVGTKNSLIDVSTKALNSDKLNKKLLDETQFNDLCNEINYILKELCESIIDGNISISKNNKKEHCKYCEFKNICRKTKKSLHKT